MPNGPSPQGWRPIRETREVARGVQRRSAQLSNGGGAQNRFMGVRSGVSLRRTKPRVAETLLRAGMAWPRSGAGLGFSPYTMQLLDTSVPDYAGPQQGHLCRGHPAKEWGSRCGSADSGALSAPCVPDALCAGGHFSCRMSPLGPPCGPVSCPPHCPAPVLYIPSP